MSSWWGDDVIDRGVASVGSNSTKMPKYARAESRPVASPLPSATTQCSPTKHGSCPPSRPHQCPHFRQILAYLGYIANLAMFVTRGSVGMGRVRSARWDASRGVCLQVSPRRSDLTLMGRATFMSSVRSSVLAGECRSRAAKTDFRRSKMWHCKPVAVPVA